ncbi:uncharacterized protein LOC120171043 [Hibiscus syriacus]|uniref:uncharacterized protein LOC120171043 n=1 Tax=Hibiscus syriacus TaxID=106335 RepID=UPI001921DF35|nr:uncharacterized protein LOC120171043 [Hibiscus syriacus]
MEKKWMGLSWSLGGLGSIVVLVAQPKIVDAMSCEDATTAFLPSKHLPQKCGVSVLVPIDPTTNCDT